MCLDSFAVLIKQLRTVLEFLFVNCLTHAHLMKTSMAHNKYLTLQFLEDNDPVSAKYATKILSLNLE